MSRKKENEQQTMPTRVRAWQAGKRDGSAAGVRGRGGDGSGGNMAVDAVLTPKKQEKLNGAEEFYDDSLFALVDMLDEVRRPTSQTHLNTLKVEFLNSPSLPSLIL